MKRLTNIAAMIAVAFSAFASVAMATEACNESCQHQKALQDLKSQVLNHSVHDPSDDSCPAAGSKLKESSKVIEGGLLSAQGSLRQIQQTVATEAQNVQADQSQCGSCRQDNVITTAVVSRPKQAGTNASCASHASQTVRGDFTSEQEAQAFAEQTMKGGNPDGERLLAGCPDPCSFYVYTGETPVGNGKIHLTLLVRCGDPRGSLFAKYSFGGATIQEWTCHAK